MAQSKPQRKSDRTRSAIVRAASRLFGENGYDRTTVREIAAEAGIDPALVIRYFGSKDQLFAHAAHIDLALPDLSGIDREAIGITLARHYIRVWEGEIGSGGLPILLRSAASNEGAAEHMREIFRSQVLPAVRRADPGPGASQRAALVASQLLGMALCRYILKLPPLVSMPPARLAEEIGRTIQAYATGEPR